MRALNASFPAACSHGMLRCHAQGACRVQARPASAMSPSCSIPATSLHISKQQQHRHMLGSRLSSTSSVWSRQHGRATSTTVHAGRDVDIADRAVASLPYLVPLFDGLKYGTFLFAQFPALANLLSLLNPLTRLYFSFPFASLIVFFGIYSGIVNNFRFSRFVRFNALQSILLDIILIVPGLLEQIIKPPMRGAGLTIYIQLYNSIFFFVFACVLYAVASCLAGQLPRLPLVAGAADQQVR